MKQLFKKIMLTLITMTALLAPLSLVATANAQVDINNKMCEGANISDSANCNTSAQDDVYKMITNIINVFSWVVGVVAVIMIMFGGFQYITAGGNDQNVGKAKNTILYAVIGLVVVALAQVIVRFVISKASTID